MAKCIYCGAVANSQEDWLPRGFGAFKHMTLLKERLCVDCNTTLGREVDQDFVRTGPTGILRSMLQIEGRNGPIPSPFLYKVMGPVSTTTMHRPSPSGEYQILGDPYTEKDGTGHVAPLRQLVFRKADGQVIPVPFPPSYDGQRLAALLRERNVTGDELFEVYLGPDEDGTVFDARRVLIDAMGRSGPITVYYGRGTSARADVRLEAGISRAYLRGMAKVGFHYYLWTSKIHTGSEFLFQPIRQFIRHGDGDWTQFIQLTAPHFVEPLADGKVPVRFSHFFGVWKAGRSLTSGVQFFVGPKHVTPPSLIRLAYTSRPIESRCHLASYYHGKVNSYHGEIEEVTR
jgi:hypothetical protein